MEYISAHGITSIGWTNCEIRIVFSIFFTNQNLSLITIFLKVKTSKVLDSHYKVDNPDKYAAYLVRFLSGARRACGFQNLVRISVYGGHNLLPPGWNRVEVAANTCWGPVPMSPGIVTKSPTNLKKCDPDSYGILE